MAPFIETTEHFIFVAITALIAELLLVTSLITHCCNVYRHKEIADNKKHRSIVDVSMSILTILSMTGFTICISIGGPAVLTCNLLASKLPTIAYNIGKGCMYLVFTLRLHIVYNRSIYAYNTKLLIIYGIWLIITYIFIAIFGFITISTKRYTISLFGDNFIVCNIPHDFYEILISGIMDLSNSLITLIPFIIPIPKIIKSLNEKYTIQSRQMNQDLLHPAIKVLILTMVANITSIFAHVIAALTETVTPFFIDIPINSTCVMLMTLYYDKVYIKLCCGLIKVVGYCCRINNKIDGVDIEMDVTEQLPSVRTDDCHESQFQTEDAAPRINKQQTYRSAVSTI